MESPTWSWWYLKCFCFTYLCQSALLRARTFEIKWNNSTLHRFDESKFIFFFIQFLYILFSFCHSFLYRINFLYNKTFIFSSKYWNDSSSELVGTVLRNFCFECTINTILQYIRNDLSGHIIFNEGICPMITSFSFKYIYLEH